MRVGGIRGEGSLLSWRHRKEECFTMIVFRGLMDGGMIGDNHKQNY